MTEASKQAYAVVLQGLQDRLCVYKEHIFIRKVRVAMVKTDSWGVHFTFQILPAPGFEPDDSSSFSASAAWEYIDISDRSVSTSILAMWSNWILVVRSDLVERITSAAAQGMSIDELMRLISNLAC